MPRKIKVAVVGAGALGCFFGCQLADKSDEIEVVLIGRETLLRAADNTDGVFTVVATDGNEFKCRPTVTDDYAHVAHSDVIIVAVKSFVTRAVSVKLLEHLQHQSSQGPPKLIYSFQNGVNNQAVIEESIPAELGVVVSSMIVPNIVWDHETMEFRMTTSGMAYIGNDLERIPIQLHDTHQHLVETMGLILPTSLAENMQDVLYSKLLRNTINAVNALAGIDVKTMLTDRRFRRLWGAAYHEGYLVCTKAGIHPVLLQLPAWSFSYFLGLPDMVFMFAARKMMSMGNNVRTSMLVDLENHRKTEIDYICGAIVDLADKVGAPAPINRKLVQLVKRADEDSSGSPGFSSEKLADALGLSL